MKKLLFIGVVLSLFLTSCHKKEHCEKEVQKDWCGTKDHNDENWDDKDVDSDWDKDEEWEDKDWDKDDKDYDKGDKKWWWKKKKGYDKDDCDEVYPEKGYDKDEDVTNVDDVKVSDQ